MFDWLSRPFHGLENTCWAISSRPLRGLPRVKICLLYGGSTKANPRQAKSHQETSHPILDLGCDRPATAFRNRLTAAVALEHRPTRKRVGHSRALRSFHA